jgi:hypothetical protein
VEALQFAHTGGENTGKDFVVDAGIETIVGNIQQSWLICAEMETN